MGSEDHRGWGVELYPPDQANADGQCLAFDSTDDGSLATLPDLMWGVLRSFTRSARKDAAGPQPEPVRSPTGPPAAAGATARLACATAPQP